MPPLDDSPLLDLCPSCGTMIDVSEEEPFSEVHCPVCGANMRVRTQFNNFALQKVLGEGGMGTVFEARDLNLQRLVAVKILKKEFSNDAASIAKLETEARITASVNHSHVVKVFSAGQDHGRFYLAMELVGKGTLDELMTLQGRVAEIQVLDVGIQVADGLRAAAQVGLIHRDIKPGNILFADARTAKVVDFGLAILMEDEAKSRGEIWGTPYYVAPEKLNNEAEDFRSDIYSLGGTMFHAVSGRPPFEAASASLVALKHLKSQAVSLQAFAPDVSNETAYVINRMLHKDPLERYQSYDELIEHLKYARAQLLERSAAGKKTRPRVVVESETARSFTAGISLALIALTLGVGGFVYSKRATLFGTGTSPAATVAKPSETNQAMPIYQAARQSLARGETEDAIDGFDKVIATTKTEPLASWARLQKGLAYLIGGKRSDALDVFADLKKKGLYSEDPSEIRLANFFVECGRLASGKNSIPKETTRVYRNTDFEAMGLLLFALKDWNLGEINEAGPLLGKFAEAKPEESYRWINDYQPLAAKYLADYQIYHSLEEKITAATTPAAHTEALAAIKDAKARVVTTGPLPELLQTMERDLPVKFAAQEKGEITEQVKTAHTNTVQETAEWEKLTLKTREPIRSFEPESVVIAIAAAKFGDPDFIKKREDLQKQVEWLMEFKTKLIAGINTGRYTGRTTNRRGSTIPGLATAADKSILHVRSPYGEVPLPWKEVSPDCVLAMATTLLDGADPGHKQWLMGVYQTLCGDEAKGRQMLIDAAQSDEKLRDDLTVFFGAPAAPG